MEVPGPTIGAAFAAAAARHPSADALVFPRLGRRWTWSAFAADVDRAARALIASGLAPGAHAGVWATNHPEWVILQFAAARAGVVLVNVNPAYRTSELSYALTAARIAVLFLIESFKDSRYFDMLAEVRPGCPELREAIALGGPGAPGVTAWSEFLARADAVPASALDARCAGSGDDVANIQFTSGTTGSPKGAMLTHANLLANGWHMGAALRLTAADRLCIPVPFYHCFGCVIGTLMCALRGTAMVIPAESFDPLATLEAVSAERCTALHGVPTMFIAELEHPRFAEFDLSSLRTGIMAGSPCPIEVMRQVIGRMGAREMTIAYGQTESSPGITVTDPDDPIEPRCTTIGRALPGVEVRIVAPGTLDDLPDETPGELICRGHNVMKGYYGRPAETAAAITPDGWLRTGDLAARTPEGRYRITGRCKDLIIRGGENVSPREIEEFLYGHPAVLDVQVVGLPDVKLGEEVSAWIRLRAGHALTADELRAYCKGRIAHFKVPRYVSFVEQFPTTVTGKIQKFRLREIGIEQFGLAEAAAVRTA